jgi:hypothetical protein
MPSKAFLKLHYPCQAVYDIYQVSDGAYRLILIKREVNCYYINSLGGS